MVGDCFQAETRLVDWDATLAAENNLVIVFIVSVSAYLAAGIILLNLLSSLIQFLEPVLDLLALGTKPLVLQFLHFLHLIHDFPVLKIIPLLLLNFKTFQKISLKLAGIVEILQKRASVL